MKSLIPLYKHLLIDASRWCRASTIRDLQTITDRVEQEGQSFITITLPRFCSDFEKALADAQIAPSAFLGFKKTGALPSFLRGLTEQVFDQKSGALLDNPDVIAIFFIRQVCLYAKKILLPCTEKRTRAAFLQYVQCELDVQRANLVIHSSNLKRFEDVSRLLFGNVLAKINEEVEAGTLIPRHGPGKTADRLIGNRKFELRRWTKRLESNFFPLADFVIPNYGFYDNLQTIDVQDPGTEQPVKVVCVPKTLKAPRIIAMEPAHMQYAQQALLELFVKYLECDKLIGKMVRFTDQIPNQSLAQKGSMSGDFATLDLSEASDRVSLRLVSRLLKPYPALLRAVMACRSQRADVPGFGVIHLSKFASMGSALCFPLEAMVFLTIVFCGFTDSPNVPLTFARVKSFDESVRVFGDDIIVPTDKAQTVIDWLHTFGMKVNITKSFWTGKFRESCGGEYYAGVSVKPIRLTMPLPDNRRDAEEFIALVSHRNQLYEAGLWSTTQYIDSVLERLSPFPTVGRDSSALGRWSFLRQLSEERWDSSLQRWLVKAAVVDAKAPVSRLDDYGALMKFFLKRGDEPIYSKNHLERAGRPNSVDTRVRWVSSI